MRMLLVAALTVALAVASPASDDGTAVPSCTTKLVPCGAFLNSTTTPAATCCGPLKEAAFNETKCMCAMLLNKAALQALGVAPEQGMALAKRCGVTVDASVCNKYTDDAAAGSSTSSTGTPASTGNGGTTLRHSLTTPSMAVGFIWWTITMA